MKKTVQASIVTLLSLAVWAVFAMPTLAASPYTDQFENYNSTGWVQHINSMLATTTDCYIGACIYSSTNGTSAVYHNGSYTSIGGLRVYYKTTANTSGIEVDLCETTDLTCAGTSKRLYYQDQPTDRNYHYVDMVFIPTATSTCLSSYKDGSTIPVPAYTFCVSAGTSTLIYNSVQLVGNNQTGQYSYFDSLENEYSLQQVSSEQIANQSLLISTSTINETCASNNSTSTGILSEVGSQISQGLCSAFSYLFIPSTDILSAFSNISTLLNDKIPFSYYYGIRTIYVNSTATSSDFYTIGFYADDLTQNATSSPLTTQLLPHVFIGLSTTTISQYFPDSLRLTARNLISFVLYIGFALYLYRAVLSVITSGGKNHIPTSKYFPEDFE